MQWILGLFLLSVSLATFAKTPITHESMWLMKRVGAPVPSPDGKWVVFAVTEAAYDDKDQRTDLWIVPSDGSGKPRQITFTKAGESGVTWSLDSRQIAFAAKRDTDENNQVYVLNLITGGEAMRVTNYVNGATGPKFSPDGKSILFSSTVYPGAVDEEQNKKIAADRKARKYRARVYENFPIRNWDRWLEDMQTHVFVQSLEPGAKAKDLLAGTDLVKAAGGFGGLTTSGGDDLQAVWAPDGQGIVFTATENRHAGAYADVITSLYLAPVNGGAIRRLTDGKDSYSKPVFRPDGKALYAAMEKHGPKVYNLDRLVMIAWPGGGESKVLTSSFDRAIGSLGFTPDSSRIYFTAEDAGHEKLYTMPATGGEVKLVFDMSLGAYANLALAAHASAPVLVANFDSAVNPPEVVRIQPDAKQHQFLTSFNTAKVAELDLPPLRHLWFTSSRGKKIHSMVALPPNFDESKKYPLLVLMHGGPHSQWRDQWVIRWNYHLLAQPGYVVLLTNYTGSTGFGEKFAQEIQGDPLAGPAQEINEAADAAIAKFSFIDSSRQCAGGASYGGHLANWLQATTTRYKCLISHAGLINLESQWGTSDTIYHREVGMGGPVWEQGEVWIKQNPIRFAKSFRTPILLTVGENDFRVPLNQTLENWSVLKRLQIPSKLIVFPEENHWILKGENSRFFYQELQSWLGRYLKDNSASGGAPSAQ